MEVLRVPNQGGGTLREFYADCVTDPESRRAEIGLRMLALLDRLAANNTPQLWGMTSHLVLHLFTDLGSSGGVGVHGHGPGYVVESSCDGVSGSVWTADADGAVALALAALRMSSVRLPDTPSVSPMDPRVIGAHEDCLLP